MQRKVGEGNGIAHRSCLDAVEDLLAQGFVQRAEQQLVGLGDAHLIGRLAEVRLVAWDRAVQAELSEHPIRPCVGRCLGLDQLRGPSSPEHRATTQAIGEAREADGHIRPPREPPHLGPRHPGVARRGRRRHQVEAGHVVGMLGQDVGPGIEDQDPVVAEAITREGLQGERGAE